MDVYASNGSNLSDAHAQVLAATVEQIAAENGACEPAALVEAAKDQTSPLHGLFEWDNSIAGHKYRVEQARRYIRAVRFVIEGRDGPAELHRFHHVHIDGRHKGYVPFERVAERKDFAQQILDDGLRRLATWRTQFGALQSVLGEDVFKHIDAALEKRPAPK